MHLATPTNRIWWLVHFAINAALVKNSTEQRPQKNKLQSILFRRVAAFTRTRWGKLSVDDVRWAYMFFLGRYPENHEVVFHHINTVLREKAWG